MAASENLINLPTPATTEITPAIFTGVPTVEVGKNQIHMDSGNTTENQSHSEKTGYKNILRRPPLLSVRRRVEAHGGKWVANGEDSEEFKSGEIGRYVVEKISQRPGILTGTIESGYRMAFAVAQDRSVRVTQGAVGATAYETFRFINPKLNAEMLSVFPASVGEYPSVTMVPLEGPDGLGESAPVFSFIETWEANLLNTGFDYTTFNEFDPEKQNKFPYGHMINPLGFPDTFRSNAPATFARPLNLRMPRRDDPESDMYRKLRDKTLRDEGRLRKNFGVLSSLNDKNSSRKDFNIIPEERMGNDYDQKSSSSLFDDGNGVHRPIDHMPNVGVRYDFGELEYIDYDPSISDLVAKTRAEKVGKKYIKLNLSGGLTPLPDDRTRFGRSPLDQAMRAVGRERLAELLKKYSVPGQFPGIGFIQSFEAGKDAEISDDVTYEDVIDKKNPKMQL